MKASFDRKWLARLLQLFYRRCPGRGRAASFSNIVAAGLGVVAGCGQVGLRVTGSVGIEHFLQKGPAPTATGSCAVALGELAGAVRAFESQVISHFAPSDMKAEAKFFVGLHGIMPPLPGVARSVEPNETQQDRAILGRCEFGSVRSPGSQWECLGR